MFFKRYIRGFKANIKSKIEIKLGVKIEPNIKAKVKIITKIGFIVKAKIRIIIPKLFKVKIFILFSNLSIFLLLTKFNKAKFNNKKHYKIFF